MKQLCTVLGAAASSILLVTPGALAQENQPAPTPIVEIFGCTYRDGSDIGDARAMDARFNAWADRNNVRNYTSFRATPYAFSAELENDVLWIGAWPNGTVMGTEETTWLEQGREIAAAFDAMSDCASHSLYAEVVINEPAGAQPPQNPVALFEDCTVREGRTVEEAIAAAEQWVEYKKGRGFDEFNAILFPLAGLTNDADYTFKNVIGFDSMAAFGKSVDMYTGGGFMRADELFGRLLDCNSPRVYTLERVRVASAATPSG